MIYLDNAATTFPKPEGVSDAMKYYLDRVGANINRSVYAAAQDAGLATLELREAVGRLFCFPEPATHVLLTPGATAGLNFVLKGLLRPGDHCLVSAMEHNAVMRPLRQLAGVEFDRIPCSREGFLDLSAAAGLFRPNTRLCLIAHASNVCGTLQDAAGLSQLCRARGVPLVLDAAQTAGHVPIDFEALGLAGLCAPGHKGLLGPSGIGVLLLRDELARAMTPLIAGGTGSASDSEDLPDYLPDRFESGTANLPGVYGLRAAVEYVLGRGVEALRAHEMALCGRFLQGLEAVPGARLVGPGDLARRVGVVAVDFPGRDTARCADRLEREFGILTRCGLHCAPAAHRSLGTFPAGVVRFSLGPFNTAADIDAALAGIAAVSAG